MSHNDANGLPLEFLSKGIQYNVNFRVGEELVMHKAPDNAVRPSQSNFHESILKGTDQGSQDGHEYFGLFLPLLFWKRDGFELDQKGKDISTSNSQTCFCR